MKRKSYCKLISAFAAAALIVTTVPVKGLSFNAFAASEETQSAQTQVLVDDLATLYNSVSTNRVSVHDPSILADEDGYYVFGSHMGVAKSDDLMNWSNVTSESADSTLFADADGNIVSFENAFGDEIAQWISDNTISGNMWAPDIIYNESMDKYCMYLSLNGATWNSAIVLLTADSVEGPYVYQGPVVYSGFSTSDSTKSFKDTDLELVTGELDELPEKYQKISDGTWGTYWPHAIDPCVFYDDEGDLWMSYGSWSGGIYMLELDESNGLRDYTASYDDNFDDLGASVTEDPYFGIKIAGGYYVSGEGSYIQKIEDYYYLFMSYGFYSPEGGYNMRVFRSETPDGPYTDPEGNSAIFTKYIHNYNTVCDNVGLKLMGNYKWDTMSVAEIAQGHNSAFVDSDGKAYVVYHTKFNDGTAGHQVRVHQLFINEEGWPVCAPYEYSGETISSTGYTSEEICGNYSMIIHDYHTDYASLSYEAPVSVTLNEDGTISGDYSGSWTIKNNTPYADIVIDGKTFSGVFTEQVIDGTDIATLCFTVVDDEGLCVWGSKVPEDKVNLALNNNLLTTTVPENTFADISLPSEGINGATVQWSSDNEAVLSGDGKIGNVTSDTTVTLTQKVSSGDYYYTKEYKVTVKPLDEDSEERILLAEFFKDTETDISTVMTDRSLSFANPFYQYTNYGLDLSGGATISFDIKKTGDLHFLGTIFSFLGANDNGRLYFTPGSYLGYNATGGFFDANILNYGLVTDYLGDESHVDITFTQNGFTVSVDGETAYTETILSTENGSASIADFSNVLTWLQESALTLNFGFGSWWSAAGYDEANCTISNVCCYAEPIVEEPAEKMTYIEDDFTLESADSITYKENPFYGKKVESLDVQYTINFTEGAEKNGWDSIFSFYNSINGGRVSFQTNPYVCFNYGANDIWYDINQPGLSSDNIAPALEYGVDYTFNISITPDKVVMTIDGTEINVSVNSSNADLETLLDFIPKCDQLTLGTGSAVTSYWFTEKCTINDLSFTINKDVEVETETESVTESEAETESVTETEAETESVTETEAETESVTETEAETESVTETETEAPSEGGGSSLFDTIATLISSIIKKIIKFIKFF